METDREQPEPSHCDTHTQKWIGLLITQVPDLISVKCFLSFVLSCIHYSTISFLCFLIFVEPKIKTILISQMYITVKAEKSTSGHFTFFTLAHVSEGSRVSMGVLISNCFVCKTLIYKNIPTAPKKSPTSPGETQAQIRHCIQDSFVSVRTHKNNNNNKAAAFAYAWINISIEWSIEFILFYLYRSGIGISSSMCACGVVVVEHFQLKKFQLFQRVFYFDNFPRKVPIKISAHQIVAGCYSCCCCSIPLRIWCFNSSRSNFCSHVLFFIVRCSQSNNMTFAVPHIGPNSLHSNSHLTTNLWKREMGQYQLLSAHVSVIWL